MTIEVIEATFATVPVERLPGVIDGCLWEFEDPENWPDLNAVNQVMQA